MDKEPRTNDCTSPVVLLAIGFLLGAVVVGACWFSSRTPEVARHSVVRDVTVDYMYETSPGSASGSKDLSVDSIEFLPGYVVMTDTRGRTQLLALDRLRKFNYRPIEE